MIIISEDEDIPHLAYLMVHGVVEVVGSLLPGTALHQPAPILDDGTVAALPAVQVHGRAVDAGNIQRTPQFIDVNGFGCCILWHVCDKIIRVKLLVECVIEGIIKDSSRCGTYGSEDDVLYPLGILVGEGELCQVVIFVGPFAFRVGKGDFLILGIIPEEIDFIASQQVFGKMGHGWRNNAGVALEGAGLPYGIVDFLAFNHRLLALEGWGNLLLAQTVEYLLAAERVREEQHRVCHGLRVVYPELLLSLAHAHGIGKETALALIVESVGRHIEGGYTLVGMDGHVFRSEGGGVHGVIAVEILGYHDGDGAVCACCMQVFTMPQAGEFVAVEQGEEESVEERLAAHVDIHGGIVGSKLARPAVRVAVARMLGDFDGAVGHHGLAHVVGYERAQVVYGHLARNGVVVFAEHLFIATGDGDDGILAAYLEGEGVELAGEDGRNGLVDNCNHISVSLKQCKDRMIGEKIKIPSRLTATGHQMLYI